MFNPRSSRKSDQRSQESRILSRLEADWPSWTPAPALAEISLQYGARVLSLRRKGWLIQNRVRRVAGVRHGEFRLGSAPVPSSRELREQHATEAASKPLPAESFFGDLMPDRSYRE